MKNFIKKIAIFGITTLIFPVHSMEKNQKPYHTLSMNTLKNINPPSERNTNFTFTTIKFLSQPHDNEVLENIYHAVSGGSSITSLHDIKPGINPLEIDIVPYQNSVSVYKLIENWYKFTKFPDKNKKNSLLVTILRGKLNRKEKLSCALIDGARDKLKIDVPEDIIHLLLSYLSECNLDEEKKKLPKLLAQARKEFDEQ